MREKELLAVMEPLSPPPPQILCLNPPAEWGRASLMQAQSAFTAAPFLSQQFHPFPTISIPFPVPPSLSQYLHPFPSISIPPHHRDLCWMFLCSESRARRALVRKACSLSPKISTGLLCWVPGPFTFPVRRLHLEKYQPKL